MHFLNPTFLLQTFGLIGVFAIVFAETGMLLGLFLPGDSLLFVAGLFAWHGYFSIWILVIGTTIAAIIGDSTGYWIGKKAGPRIFVREESFFFKKSHVEKTQSFFDRYGAWTIFVAHFIPFVRTIAPTMAGVGQMPYRIFLFWNVLGGIAWTALFIFSGYFLGRLLPNGEQVLTYVTVGIIVVSLIPAGIQIVRMIRSKS
jgi:membrane-associated protein